MTRRTLLNRRLTQADASPSKLPATALAAFAITGRYDPLTTTYNMQASSLRRFRGKLAKALAGEGVCRIVGLGDSTEASKGVCGNTRGLTTPADYMMKQLAAAGLPVAGTGLVPPSQSETTTPDPRWTFTGTWADAQLYRQSGALGSTATFTSTTAGTVVEIKMIQSTGTLGSWTYSIDGAAAVTVANVVGSSTYGVTVTGLANTTHTVVITQSTSTIIRVAGVDVRAASGIEVSNFGVGGITSAAMASATYAGTVMALGQAPDLVTVNIGINDYFTQVSLATFKANLTAAANYYTPASDFMFIVGNPVSASYTIPRTSYTAAMYEVAETLGLPVLDLTERWGAYTSARTAGLIADLADDTTPDGTHPRPAGNADIARARLKAVGLL